MRKICSTLSTTETSICPYCSQFPRTIWRRHSSVTLEISCQADHQATTWTLFGFPLEDNNPTHLSHCSPPSTQQTIDYRRLRGLKYHENRLRLLTCIYECITTRILGQTFNLTCSSDYHRWLEKARHNWLPSLPSYDLLQHTESEMSSSQESPIDSPTSFQPDICSHNSNQSQVSPRESREDNIEFHPSDPLGHDNSVHYSSPICGIRRIRSHSSSRALSSDRPPQRARVTYAEVATDVNVLTPDYPWISGTGYRVAVPGSSTIGSPPLCPDSRWSFSKWLTRSLNESCLIVDLTWNAVVLT